mmetsp:Transcript_7777/g.14117  ORF Transcript_7777/g.14117 Transcript_7777/m.14117 type:complete len:249 (+) Transcript_7777:1157-1903(+)
MVFLYVFGAKRRKSIGSITRLFSIVFNRFNASSSCFSTSLFNNQATASFLLNNTTIALSPPSPKRSVLNSTPEPGCIIRRMMPSPPSTNFDIASADTSIAVSDSFREIGRGTIEVSLSKEGAKHVTIPTSIILHHVKNGLRILAAIAYSCSTPISAETSEMLPTESMSSFASSIHSALSYSAAATALSCFRSSDSNRSSKNSPSFSLLFISFVLSDSSQSLSPPGASDSASFSSSIICKPGALFANSA